MRFHILGIPHTATNKDYVACAFTQKVLKFGKMMTNLGHEVIHYGNEDSDLICSEHVSVTTKQDLEISYGAHDWKSNTFKFDTKDHAYQVFIKNTIKELEKRIKKFDFILPFFGTAHQPICEYFDKRWFIQVEPGIGYIDTFAPCRIFESYAIYHSIAGNQGLRDGLGMSWYDAVIPNYFDREDFTYTDKKDNYFLYLGRVVPLKGIDIAIDVTKTIGAKLIIAGQMGNQSIEFPSHVEFVGYADATKKRELMSKATAGIVPSRYNEPFGGVQIEMLMSGTPTITTDWGAFTENNLHGFTGYRCRTFEQFVWAAKNIKNIDPKNCRQWAENFTLEKIGIMYEEYFTKVLEFYKYQNWYFTDNRRTNLDWLTKTYPL